MKLKGILLMLIVSYAGSSYSALSAASFEVNANAKEEISLAGIKEWSCKDRLAQIGLVIKNKPIETCLVVGGSYFMYEYGWYVLRDLLIVVVSNCDEAGFNLNRTGRFLKYIPANLVKLCIVTGLTYSFFDKNFSDVI